MNGIKKNIIFWSLAATGFFAAARNVQAQIAKGSVSASAILAADTSNRMPGTYTGSLVFTITATY